MIRQLQVIFQVLLILSQDWKVAKNLIISPPSPLAVDQLHWTIIRITMRELHG